MTPLDELKSEIDARVIASHPEIVLNALTQLLQDVSEAHADILSGACSYHVHYRTYITLLSRITFLRRVLDRGWAWGNQWMEEDGWSSDSKVTKMLSAVDSNVRSLRMKRYENVCGKCAACRTRRKQWPDQTRFIDPAAPASLAAYA
jgi:hypothetical protein